MSATLTEALMGLGEINVDLDYDAEVLAELVDGAVLVLSHGEAEIFAAELLWKTPSRRGMRIGGRGLDWRLGQDGDGPVILDREYIAGTNRLSNGGFELEDLYWRLAEGTAWLIAEANPHAGAWAARVSSAPTKDDELQADEGGIATRPGDEWTLGAWIKRLSGTVGRLRVRLVFEGRFDHVGVFPGGDIEPYGGFWLNYSDDNAADVDVVNDPAEAKTGDWAMRVGPCTRKQLLANGGFELGTEDYWLFGDEWSISSGVGGRSGSYAAKQDPTAGTGHTLTSDSVVGGGANAFVVRPGDRYLAEGYFRSDDVSVPDGELYMEIPRSSDGSTQIGISESPHIRPNAAGDSIWRKSEVEFSIEENVNYIWLAVIGEGVTTGLWYADDFSLTRVAGNIARIRNVEPFSVVPNKAHTLYASVRSGPNYVSGSLRPQAVFSADGRDDVVLDGSAIEGTENEWHFVAWSFTPPSGYDECRIAWIGTDIVGDSFWIGIEDMLVQYDDETTRVYDAKSPETEAAFTEYTQTITAPDGAERVQVVIVAEDRSDGWVVDDVSLARAETPTTVGTVIESLLVDPDTDEQLLVAGTIHDPDDGLLYDLHIRRQDNRSVLKHVCRSGVVSPVREFRVNPNASLDCGTADQLFADRIEAVLVPDALELLEEPTVERNWEDKVSDVLVIGAERQRASGQRVTIAGAASDAEATRRRTRIVEDSTVDHAAFADALASWHLEQSQATDEVVQLRLADWRASFTFDVGDWIYPWLPEAGLEDLDNEISIDGLSVYPKRVRALARTWRLGSGPWKLELQRIDGTRVDLSDSVRWEDATTADVTVGNVVPEFLIDPQGGAAGGQFLRFRASRPQ